MVNDMVIQWDGIYTIGQGKARCMTVAQVERAGVTKEIVEAQVGLEPDSEESSSHECSRGNILEMTITSKGTETGLCTVWLEV